MRSLLAASVFVSICILASCSTPGGTLALLGGTAATLIGGQTPNNEIQQIYYLGAFDPQGQLPPTIYRVRVHGQASFISKTRFASGWVKADLIDSLNAHVGVPVADQAVTVEGPKDGELAHLQTGRRMMLFGPEGFREAPRDHRLVIVMGASPQAFFEAIDQSLGLVAEVRQENLESEAARLLFEELQRVQEERARVADLRSELEPSL